MRVPLIFGFLALTDADILREEGKKLTDFPFRLLDDSNQQEDNSLASRLKGGGVELVGEDDDEAIVVTVSGPVTDVDEVDIRCVEKVMMVEETEWEEVVKCDHSYSQRCHQSFVTR